jgi:hypothetical protein
VQVDLLCVAAALVALVLGYVLGWLGGHAVGRYKGERGRREAAENMLAHGAPVAARASRVRLRNGSPVEPKIAPQGFDQATVEKGARAIQAQSRAAGVPVPSDEQAEMLARDMLMQGLVGAGEPDDIAIG